MFTTAQLVSTKNEPTVWLLKEANMTRILAGKVKLGTSLIRHIGGATLSAHVARSLGVTGVGGRLDTPYGATSLGAGGPGPARARSRRSPAIFVKAVMGLALAGLVILAAPPARAQQLCLVRANAVAQLKRDHGEEPKALGLVEGGRAVVELFVSDEGGWTLLLTDAEGHTCLVGSGAAWTAVAPRPRNPA